MNFELNPLDQNRKSVRRARLQNMLLRLLPNRILSDAVTEIMASRSKSLNVGTHDAIHTTSVKRANSKTSIKNECHMMSANPIFNSIQDNCLTKLILVILYVQENLANNVHVAFHKSVMWPNEKSSGTRDQIT